MKRILMIFIVLVMVMSMGTSVFADDNTLEMSSRDIESSVSSGSGSLIEPKVGRHYTERIEVVKDRISNKYVYSSNGKKRAYVYSETHYKIYRRRVGDATYKEHLYDEYHTTWRGEEKNSSGKWVITVAKKSETSRERSPIIAMLGILM